MALIMAARNALSWPDGKRRCAWANPGNPAYLAYHDTEWGRPLRDDGRLFEMLVLETFQAGLSWECVLNKRRAFRMAFDGFDCCKVSRYGEAKTAELMANAGIIRNLRKIRAAIGNAAVFLAIRQEWTSFADYIWHWTDNCVVRESCRVFSPLSEAVAADLARRGMSFVGPRVIYAYLQGIGVINSHEPGCFLHKADLDAST